MTDAAPKLTVDLLTGFLGAGKTRLLRRLLAAGALPDTAVLVNEFAELPIDQRLIAPLGPVTEIFAGNCLCCAIDGDLRASLLRLLERRAAGSAPSFSRILIETSGIADPGPVIATLLHDRLLQQRLRFGVTVTLVDLANMIETLDEQEESVAQLIAADRLVLTKSDLVDEARKIEVMAAIRAVNPAAEIVTLDPDGRLPAELWAPLSWQPIAAPKRAMPAHRHSSAVSATVLHWPDAVDWAGFATWLSLLLHRHGAKMLRVKGLMMIAGAEDSGPVVVQAVRHVVYAPEHLAGDHWTAGAEIVVIGRGIDPLRLRRSFEIFMRLSAVSGHPKQLALIS